MARLTPNANFGNINFGDRLMAMWQGNGYYTYITCNTQNNNPNQLQNINFPGDIEGLWTYIYYSHGKQAGRSVGFAQYGSGQPQRI